MILTALTPKAFNAKPRRASGFTLIELLVSVAIFAVVAVIVASMYIQAVRETKRTNTQNQIYEDARFLMAKIADEIHGGMIDYDEYYAQNVIKNSPEGVPVLKKNFGQNFGAYYSAFYHPGSDEALGFDCNTVTLEEMAAYPVGSTARSEKRNRRDCTPIRGTLDRNTGTNPFKGKYVLPRGMSEEDMKTKQDAFCGQASQGVLMGSIDNVGQCDGEGGAPPSRNWRAADMLFLITKNGMRKTILAREKIGATDDEYAISVLRLKGIDTDSDNIADSFVCADDFQCRGGNDMDVAEVGFSASDTVCFGSEAQPTDLPRMDLSTGSTTDLEEVPGGCDSADKGFSKDFVPISPFRVKVTELKFYITPPEYPAYAFDEGALQQPKVTVVLTVEQNPSYTGIVEAFEPVTLVETISPRVLTPISAPLLTQ